MTHLRVDPAGNASLLVNKLVERFILWFTRGDPWQGVWSLNCLGIHLVLLLLGGHTGSCQVEALLVGMELRSMCGESLTCLRPLAPHGQWTVSTQIDSRTCETFL